MEFSEFERAVIGFYTDIPVPRSLPPVAPTLELEDQLLFGASGNLRSDTNAGISFHLQTDGGYIVYLEGIVCGPESWPDEDDIEVVPSYIERRKSGPGSHE